MSARVRGDARVAYLTDVEGRWDKLASFAEGSEDVSLAGDALRLADGVTFVFGGDASDRGPHARRVLTTLLEAKRLYGERVVLLAGNRDINKLRLARELTGAPPPRTPEELKSGPRGPLLRWILSHTMGAKEAFEHRRTELGARGARHDDEAIVESFLEDVAPGGLVREYLTRARLGYRSGATLFVHGGVTAESLGRVPGRDAIARDVDAWVRELDAFHAEEVARFCAGHAPDALMTYQAPLAGTRWNQQSVVYGRVADEHANPVLPERSVIRTLRESGVCRLVVGHTPSGDCPAIVREGSFELVLADNSHGRVERGSRVCITDASVTIAGETVLDDGTRASVAFTAARGEEGSPLGLREKASGRLVKSRLASGEYLLFRGLPGYRVEQTSMEPDELATFALEPAR